MAANKLPMLSSTLLVAALVFAAALCTLPPLSTAAPSSSTSPALPSAATGSPSSGDDASSSPISAATTQPAATTSATASKKFPLPAAGGEVPEYVPAAEVASALPVPTPDELPSAASLGFGGHGDECCGGGGYGWFGGPGGYGPGTYGYSGPLYFGAAAPSPARNALLPLLVACVSAVAICFF